MNDTRPHSFPVDVHRRLSSKIVALLMLFFAAAVVAIGTTLYVSWQLEGSGATINDAGSQRMRAFHLGLLAAGAAVDGRETLEIAVEIERFEEFMDHLERGHPERRIAPPRDAETISRIAGIRDEWRDNGRPLLDAFLAARETDARVDAVARYRRWVAGFVPEIDGLVRQLERQNAFATTLLRSAQVALLALAILGTAVLIRFFFVLVIRPLDQLYAGMRRIAGDDFSVRLATGSNDEFGVVASGFNRMATHLQQLYHRLEDMVAAKTGSLAERNRELGLLYEVTAFLNQPATSVEALCQGFLKRVQAATGANASSVRLSSGQDDEIFLVAYDGLSPRFVDCEQALRSGECACGHAMNSGTPIILDTRRRSPMMTRNSCLNEGLRTVSAFTVSHNQEAVGLFNLYFNDERSIPEPEQCLLETLGQHLGVAIENLRLRSRDRELAIAEERNLLAQELHDSIAQGLAFLNIQVQLLQDSLDHGRDDEIQATVDQIREGVLESYEDIRELLVHFRTRVGHGDLDAVIRACLERFELQTGIPTSFRSSGKRAALAPDEQVQVIHIVQESLSNVRKHAQASQVDVDIRKDIERTQIEIADDGIGFAPDAVPSGGERHIGLKIMQERCRRIGGECRIDSSPGRGTRVTLTL